MKRSFAAYVFLGLLGGCSYIRPDADCGCTASALLPAQRPPAASPGQWTQNGSTVHPNSGLVVQVGATDPQPLTITRPNPVAGPAAPTRTLDGSTTISIPNATPPSITATTQLAGGPGHSQTS